jgi:hypothetical protein
MRIGLDHHGRVFLAMVARGYGPSSAQVIAAWQEGTCFPRPESGGAADTVRYPRWHSGFEWSS